MSSEDIYASMEEVKSALKSIEGQLKTALKNVDVLETRTKSFETPKNNDNDRSIALHAVVNPTSESDQVDVKLEENDSKFNVI